VEIPINVPHRAVTVIRRVFSSQTQDFPSPMMDGDGLRVRQSNGRNVINTSRKWSAGPRISQSHTCTHDRTTMMSHFGHEAIFTLDYTINENQTFDCLMPGSKGHPLGHHPRKRSAAISPKYKSLEKANG